MLEKLNDIFLKYQNKIAYIYKDKKLTFGELFEKAVKISKSLEKGDNSPVIIFGGKTPEVMAAIIACLIKKRAYVPVDIAFPDERKNKIIASSGAGTLIDCSKDNIEIIKTENGAQNKTKSETAYMIFTSGSTGEPKGVPISRDNLDNFINWITSIEAMNSFEHAFVLNQAAFSFDLSTAAIFYALFGGHAIVQLEDKNDFDCVFKTIEDKKTEVFVITPTFMRLCLLNNDFNEDNYPFVKCLYFCGESLQKSLCKKVFERFPDIRIINAYGPTEATSAVCASEITKEILEHEEFLPCGDIDSAAVKIYTEDDEIVLKGKSVFCGYLEKTAGGHFTENGENAYRTGDIGFIKEGKLYCKGRADSQIKYKGYRIELSDIESNLSVIDGVESCAVVAKRNPEGEVRMIKAFVCGKTDSDFIRKSLSEKLPEYMIPKSIKILKNLPVNENGKINRKELLNL
ncbi:MAG: AMP-binding protein [Oscillospiraceae bacterium]|nr:AMP-binding protein [Oscillospiraceae bacterium]